MEGVWKEAPDEADQTDQDPSVQAGPQCPLQGEDLGVMLWELLGKLLINQHFPTLGTAPSAQHQQSCSAGGLPGLFRSCLSLRPGMCFGVLRELGFCGSGGVQGKRQSRRLIRCGTGIAPGYRCAIAQLKCHLVPLA